MPDIVIAETCMTAMDRQTAMKNVAVLVVVTAIRDVGEVGGIVCMKVNLWQVFYQA